MRVLKKLAKQIRLGWLLEYLESLVFVRHVVETLDWIIRMLEEFSRWLC